MRLIKLALATSLTALPLLSTPAGAVTVGTYTQENCFPFGCLASRLGIGAVYQQAYAASAFSGSTVIDTLRFYGVGTSTIDSASYAVSFYLSPNTPTTLSTSPAANRGTLLSSFGSFTLSGATPAVLTLSGNEFTYNPAQGSLLMEVIVTGLTAAGTGNNGTFQTQGFNPVTGRLTVNGAGAAATLLPLGAVTSFEDAITAVPEPATWAMMIGGLGLTGTAMRRRNRALLAA